MSAVTSTVQPPAFRSQYSVIKDLHFDSKLTFIKQPLAFKGHFCSDPVCLKQV